MDFKLLRGTKDYEPEEAYLLNEILDKIRVNLERYGFRPLDTPIIEYFETLALKYEEGDEILGEIFKVIDRGNRDLGLRYDLTTPLFRYLNGKKQLKKPFKRYQVGKVFRDGPIKKGRLREFIQFDADIIGVEGNEVEAELLKLFYETFLDLGIKKPVIELNNYKILIGVLKEYNLEKFTQEIILSIDKLKKIGIEGVLTEVESKGIKKENIKGILSLLNKNSLDELIKTANKNSNKTLKEGINELKTLTDYLDKLNVKYRINLSMARGLAIYTGNIWEIYEEDSIITSSLGAGGRYDKINEFFQDKNKIYAAGISFGIIPIFEYLKEKKGLKKSNIDIIVVPLKKELFIPALEIAESFRSKDKKIELSYFYNLKKAFNYADYLEINNMIILGEEDFNTNKYTLRKLKTKEEKKVNFTFRN